MLDRSVLESDSPVLTRALATRMSRSGGSETTLTSRFPMATKKSAAKKPAKKTAAKKSATPKKAARKTAAKK